MRGDRARRQLVGRAVDRPEPRRRVEERVALEADRPALRAEPRDDRARAARAARAGLRARLRGGQRTAAAAALLLLAAAALQQVRPLGLGEGVFMADGSARGQQ